MDQSNLEHLQRTCKNGPLRPTTQSGPDSQTVPPQARNSASGCNATPSHGRHTGFADGRAGMRYPLPWFHLSDDLDVLLGLDPTYGLKMVLKRLVTFKYIKS